MESDLFNGIMKPRMKVNGLRVSVKVTEFKQPNQANNIMVNGKMMSVMVKEGWLKQTAQSFLEISEMICVMDYALFEISGGEILN